MATVTVEINGRPVAHASNDEVYDLVMMVASTDVPLAAIASALERLAATSA